MIIEDEERDRKRCYELAARLRFNDLIPEEVRELADLLLRRLERLERPGCMLPDEIPTEPRLMNPPSIPPRGKNK